jgi:hypothetical protein
MLRTARKLGRNGKLMVDKLKRSLEQLDPPNCPNCSIEMKWTRSTLIDDHRACFRLPRLLLYLRDQIHDQGDQFSTPEAIGTASLPRCLDRRPGAIRAAPARQRRGRRKAVQRAGAAGRAGHRAGRASAQAARPCLLRFASLGGISGLNRDERCFPFVNDMNS